MVCADQSSSRSIDFTAFDFIELSKGVPARICGNDLVLVKATYQRRRVTSCYDRLSFPSLTNATPSHCNGGVTTAMMVNEVPVLPSARRPSVHGRRCFYHYSPEHERRLYASGSLPSGGAATWGSIVPINQSARRLRRVLDASWARWGARRESRPGSHSARSSLPVHRRCDGL